MRLKPTFVSASKRASSHPNASTKRIPFHPLSEAPFRVASVDGKAKGKISKGMKSEYRLPYAVVISNDTNIEEHIGVLILSLVVTVDVRVHVWVGVIFWQFHFSQVNRCVSWLQSIHVVAFVVLPFPSHPPQGLDSF